MGENITLTPEEYMEILETILEQATAIMRLRKALQSEHAYAERLHKEIQQLKEGGHA